MDEEEIREHNLAHGHIFYAITDLITNDSKLFADEKMKILSRVRKIRGILQEENRDLLGKVHFLEDIPKIMGIINGFWLSEYPGSRPIIEEEFFDPDLQTVYQFLDIDPNSEITGHQIEPDETL